jgi:flavin-dependent dehydrogenase
VGEAAAVEAATMHIAVVGGSLAGAFLAVQLRDSPHQISILDPLAPWEKPCGGGTYGNMLSKFPVLYKVCAWNYPARFRLISSTGDRTTSTHGQWAIASRADLNRGLLDKALQDKNVQLIQERVTAVESLGTRWQLQTEGNHRLEADILIGADGVNSFVRRKLIGRLPREHLFITVGYLVSPGPAEEVIIQTYQNLAGYAWYFPRSDHASVGFVARAVAANVPAMWQRLEAFMQIHCPEAHKDSKWGASVPAVTDSAFWALPCAGANWAIIGDAAGHVNSLLGEGISYALDDAHLLAQAISQGDLSVYERAWRKENEGWLRSASDAMNSILRSGTSADYERVAAVALSGDTRLAKLYARAAAALRRFAQRRS